jgi:hypothetical protein
MVISGAMILIIKIRLQPNHSHGHIVNVETLFGRSKNSINKLRGQTNWVNLSKLSTYPKLGCTLTYDRHCILCVLGRQALVSTIYKVRSYIAEIEQNTSNVFVHTIQL